MTDTRERIRNAALTLFMQKGYSGTSIADIETAVGLAPRAGGFYRHFASKADLAVEIGETSIIETRRELGFDLLPLGDTRAELVMIAKGYRRAAERQAPLEGLIAELRHIEKIRKLEERVSADLLEGFRDWLSTKPLAKGKSPAELTALVITIFGGWVFYIFKRAERASGSAQYGLTDELMMDQWADLWARILDR